MGFLKFRRGQNLNNGGASVSKRKIRMILEREDNHLYIHTWDPIVIEIALNPPGYLDLDAAFLHKAAVVAKSCRSHHRPA